MKQRLFFDGELKFGQYKTIFCKVQLEIITIEDDEWAEPDPNYDPKQYVDGVRVTGEFSFDTSPIFEEKHPVVPNAMGELILKDGDDTTKLNILVIERNSIVQIKPKHINRYFWLFFAIGKPVWDKLKLYPENYRGVNMNKVYYCTDFRGYWPQGVSSVIVAADKKEAAMLLNQKLRAEGIPMEGDGRYTFEEINMNQKGAILLNKGECF